MASALSLSGPNAGLGQGSKIAISSSWVADLAGGFRDADHDLTWHAELERSRLGLSELGWVLCSQRGMIPTPIFWPDFDQRVILLAMSVRGLVSFCNTALLEEELATQLQGLAQSGQGPAKSQRAVQ